MNLPVALALEKKKKMASLSTSLHFLCISPQEVLKQEVVTSHLLGLLAEKLSWKMLTSAESWPRAYPSPPPSR